MCWKAMKGKITWAKTRTKSITKLVHFGHLEDVPIPRCIENVKGLFLHGRDVVQAQQVGDDFAANAPLSTKPLLQTGMTLKAWIINLATAKKAAILWAGFWTNATWHRLARLEPERCR